MPDEGSATLDPEKVPWLIFCRTNGCGDASSVYKARENLTKFRSDETSWLRMKFHIVSNNNQNLRGLAILVQLFVLVAIECLTQAHEHRHTGPNHWSWISSRWSLYLKSVIVVEPTVMARSIVIISSSHNMPKPPFPAVANVGNAQSSISSTVHLDMTWLSPAISITRMQCHRKETVNVSNPLIIVWDPRADFEQIAMHSF